MQVVQDIYNELTGKSEKLTKIFDINHKANFEDIGQLHSKILQLYEQYNIVSKNCSVTVYYIDDGKDQFSSFERFQLLDRSSTSPVENIRLVYNFLIVLPKTDRPQSYEIEVDIHSRAALRKRAQSEMGRTKIFFQTFRQTGQVDIEYVDYTVARNFRVAIEGWFNSLEKVKISWCLTFLKNVSDYFPTAFRNMRWSYIVGQFGSEVKVYSCS